MWGLRSSLFLGGIPPRLAQSAVRLRNRWLPQLGRDRQQPHDCKAGLNGGSGLFSTSSDAKRSRRPSRRVRRTAPHGAVAAAAAKHAAACSDSSASLSRSDQELSVDLDYVPTLGLASEVLCVLLPVLGIFALYTATGRWHGGALLARLAAVLGAAAGISLTRAACMERKYKARERAHAELGDADSRFRPIATQGAGSGGSGAPAGSHHPREQKKHGHHSLVVHVKVKVGDLSHIPGRAVAVSPALAAVDGEAASSGSGDGTGGGGGPGTVDGPGSVFALHCYHGFGANLGSYKRVQAALAAALRGVVTAHDMPGFGLTQRPTDVPSYFLTFNGRLGRLVMDYELQQLGLLPAEAAPGGRAGATAEPTVLRGGAGVTSAVPTPKASEGGGAVWGGSAVEVVSVVGQVGDGGSRENGSAPPMQRQRPHGRGQPQPKQQQQQQEQQEQEQGPMGSHAAAPPMGSHAAAPPMGSHAAAPPMGSHAAAPPAIQRILVGHSLGGACAALEAVSNPAGLAGLVLVAPAVIAVPGPEFDQVKLSPQNPGGSPATATTTASGAAGLPQSPSAQLAAEARAAAQLGPEPLGSHVTDPPEVRRLYPMGSFPSSRPGARDEGRTGSPPSGQRLLRALTSLLAAMASLALLYVLRLLVPVITLLLRALVRRRNFWTKGLQQAYYNPATVTPDIVDLYRMPQLVRGWEAGMVNFLLARLVRSRGSIRDVLLGAFRAEKTVDAAAAKAEAKAKASSGIAAVVATADAEAAATATSPSPPPPPPPAAATPQQGASHAGAGNVVASSPTLGSPATTSSPPRVDDSHGADGDASPADVHSDADLAFRLFQMVSERRLPVLIVHGLYDRLVPASNSQRLARMLPGCELVLLDRCGHMPQEEMPELFVSLLAEFAERLTACGAAGRA